MNSLEDFDYATPGGYFITVCTANRAKILWDTIENNPRKYLLTPAP